MSISAKSAMLVIAEQELSKGKFIDELSNNIFNYVNVHDIIDHLQNFEIHFPHLEKSFFRFQKYIPPKEIKICQKN